MSHQPAVPAPMASTAPATGANADATKPKPRPFPFPSYARHASLAHRAAAELRTQLSRQPESYPPQVMAAIYEQNIKIRGQMLAIYGSLEAIPRNDPRHHHGRDELTSLRMHYDLRFWRFFRLNDLPSEIILEIFRFVAFSDTNYGVNNRLTISTTCRLWRGLSLGDSTLWSAIMMKARRGMDQPFTWLQRAGRSSLFIRFDDDAKKPITDEEMSTLLDTLFERIYQIQVMVFLVQEWAPLLTLIKRMHTIAMRGRPLILQRLEIHRTGDLYWWPGPTKSVEGHLVTQYPIIGGPVAPKLDWLSLDGVHFEWNASSISNLTTLDLRRLPLELAPTREAFRLMLRKCPLLHRLTLDGAGPNRFFEVDYEPEPIALNHLKIILLCNFSPAYAKGILQHFSAPNLQELQLLCFMRNDYKDVFNYLAGRFPSVNLLSLVKMDFTMPGNMEALVKFFASMPKVRYLRMSNVTNAAMAALLYAPGTLRPHDRVPDEHRELFSGAGAPHMLDDDISIDDDSMGVDSKPVFLCPELLVLEVRADDVDQAYVFALLESRKSIGAPLYKLYCQGPRLDNLSIDFVANLHSRHIVEAQPLGPHQPTREETMVLSDEGYRELVAGFTRRASPFSPSPI